MKLFVKRDLSAPDAGFTVFDENGNPKYYAVFKNTRSSVKLRITDTDKNIVAKIHRMAIPAIFAFSMTACNKSARLMINPSKDIMQCYYYGLNWHINGDIISKNFSIIDVDNTCIATHKTSFCGKSDCFELEIFNNSNELFCVTTSICINLLNTVDNLVTQAV